MAFQAYRRSSLWFVFLCCLVVCFTGQQVSAQVETEKRSFDVSEGYAINTLKEAAKQAGVEFIFSADLVKGVRTSSIKGTYTPLEAFSLMLAETSLEVFQHGKTGVYAITKIFDLKTPELEQKPTEETDMNAKKNNWYKTLVAALTLGITASQGLSGQPDEAEEKLVELSRFYIPAEEQSGYLATATLAGTRLKTDLKDVGAAISVMTSDFMEDVNAVDASTLLSYALNTEVAAGDQGNFADFVIRGGDHNTVHNQESRERPQDAQRIRGLAEATLTRDFFLTSIPFDSYNTSEVTINRGPNSLLFGIGTPGGVINNGLKQAVMDEVFGATSLRLGERGSYRATVDYNSVLIKDRLAIRVGILESDTQYQQRPAFREDSRRFAALNATLFENEDVGWLGNTRLRVHYEEGDGDGIPVNTLPFFDGVSHWMEKPKNFDRALAISGADTPAWYEDGNFTPKWTVDGVNGQINGEDVQDTLNTLGPFSEVVWAHFASVHQSLTNQESNIPGRDGKTVDAINHRVFWNRNPEIPDYTRNLVDSFFSGNVFSSSDNVPGFRPSSIIDTTGIYDNRDLLLAGLSQSVKQDFDVINVRLDQTFFDGLAGIELAFNKEGYTVDSHLPFGGADQSTMLVDVNERLNNGMPNPNVGRALIYDVGFGSARNVTTTDREAFQATAFYEIDFTDNDVAWQQWLGRHVLTGFVGQQTIDNTGLSYRKHNIDIGTDTDIRSTLNARIGGWRRNIYSFVYVTDDLRGSQFQSPSDVHIDTYFKGQLPQVGDVMTVQYQEWNPIWRGDDNDRFFQSDFGVEEHLIGGGINRREIDSEVISMQSFLFNDNIVGLLGWRTDELTEINSISNAEYNAIAPDTRNKTFFTGEFDRDAVRLGTRPEDRETLSGDTFTWSIVAHKPEDWIRLPGDMQLSLHYNESENFSTSGVRRTVLGETIPAPTGTTEDVGFTLRTSDNAYWVRVNWFESKNQFATAPISAKTITNGLFHWAGYEFDGDSFEDAMALNEELNGVDLRPFLSSFDDVYDEILRILPQEISNRFEGFDDENEAIFSDNNGETTTQDFVAEGLEIDIVANFTQNWTMALNVGKQETVTSNSAPVYRKVISEMTDKWATSPLRDLMVAPQRVDAWTFWQEWTGDMINPLNALLAQDGTVSQEQRKWRANLVSKYAFKEGLFKGFEIGGAIRWQEKVATGYEITVLDEAVFPIVDRPFFGPDETNGDIWINYERSITDKIDWFVQLNFRNAYRSNTGFIPVITNPDGSHAVYRNSNPKEIFLTNTFRF